MCRAIFEAVTIIACFNNMAMVGQPIKQRGGHFGIAKHTHGSRTQLFTLADPETYKDMTDTELGDAFQAQLFK